MTPHFLDTEDDDNVDDPDAWEDYSDGDDEGYGDE